MITFRHKGSFKNTENFLKRVKNIQFQNILTKYGSAGVSALSKATPVNTGLTAASWNYKIDTTSNGFSITWYNTNQKDGIPIVILIQYGHGTGTGGYVVPRDFVNPTMKPIFDNLAENIWKEVSSL